MKGTSEEGTELGMDRARKRGEEGSERRREEASGGGRVQRSEGEVQQGAGRKGVREGVKLQGMYPDEDTGQYTLLKTTHNAALALETLVLGMKNSEKV